MAGISLDSDSYAKGDSAAITCTVKNLTAASIDGRIALRLPDSMSLADGESASAELGGIAAGETKTLTIRAVASGDNAGVFLDAMADTSDEVPSWAIAVVVVALLIALVAMLVARDGRKSGGALAVVVAASLVGGSVPPLPSATANADEVKTGTITVTALTSIMGEKCSIEADVSYHQVGAPSGQTHKVTFLLDSREMIDNAAEFSSMLILDGSLLQRPSDPISKALDFEGWYTDIACQNAYDFSSPVNSDLVLIAKTSVKPGDTDGDGLEGGIEEWYGTDPLSPDTDGDGLSDGVEVRIGTNPLAADTDGNCVSDYDEDADGDGLPNGVEIENGCDPINPDTDGDDLKDGLEIDAYGTNPLEADTDGDGAEDGWEVYYGFDPLAHNQSFDVLIGSGACSVNDPVTASVQVRGILGEQLETLHVDKVTSVDNELVSPAIPGYMGVAYEFSIDGAFPEATISFQYDQSTFGVPDETFQPRIYYVNESTGFLEKLGGQVVDGTSVSAVTTHFSTYILLNEVPFDKAWESDIKKPIGDDAGDGSMDIVFAMDCSQSMNDNDPYYLRKDATKSFIEKLRDGKDRASLVSFARNAYRKCDLTSNKEDVISAVDAIVNNSGWWFDPDAGTNGTTALRLAIDSFEGSSSSSKFIVFMTDGDDTHSDPEWTYEMLEAEAAEKGIRIFAVGLGSANEARLQEIAENTNGAYCFARAGFDLDDVYDRIEGETVDLVKDSNSDGIPDYYNDLIKDGALLLSNGSRQFVGVDFNYDADGNPSADYDGDGRLNGEELVLHVNEATGGVYLEMASNPISARLSGSTVGDASRINESVAWLMDDGNFYYEEQASNDRKNWLSVADAVLSKVFGVDRKSVFRKNILEYVNDYSSICNGEIEQSGKRKLIIDSINQLIGVLAEPAHQSEAAADLIGDLSKLIKDSADLSIQEMESAFIEISHRVLLVVPDATIVVSSTTSLAPYSELIDLAAKVSGASGSIEKMCGYVSAAVAVGDAVDTISDLASIDMDNISFANSVEMLQVLRDDARDSESRAAAQTVLNDLAGGYGAAIASIVNSAGSGAIDLIKRAAMGNPYSAAVVIALDLADFGFGLGDNYEYKFKMLSDSDLSLGYATLAHRGIDQSKIDDGMMFVPLSNLTETRLLGEQECCGFLVLNGILGCIADLFGANESRKSDFDAQKIAIAYHADRLSLRYEPLN